MAASREDVNRWIDMAKEKKTPFILSVCDTFDWDDYPIYCENTKELLEKHLTHDGVNMQRINEIIQTLPDGRVIENRNLQNLL